MPRPPSKPAPDGKPAPISAATRILILHGKERFLMDERLRVLREALIKEHGKDGVDTIRFDGAQGARILADVLDECRSMGLMQQHKIVLVDNAEQMVKSADDDKPAAPAGRGGAGERRAYVPHSARELLESYAQDPSDAATLVLRADTWRPGNLDKAVEKVGAVIKCEPPPADKALEWMQARAKVRHKTTIDPQTAALLLDTVGVDLGRIDSELEKLALAAGGEGQAITAQLVESMVGTTRQEEFWAIQASLVTAEAGATLAQLRDLIEVSRHDPVPITFAYVEMARKVHLAARGLAEGVPVNRLIPALRIFGPQQQAIVSGVLSMAKTAGPARAAQLLSAAVATDAANKSGLGDPVRNLERLTVRFSALTGSGRAAG